LVNDDLIDALSYIDKMAILPYSMGGDLEDDYQPIDMIAGY